MQSEIINTLTVDQTVTQEEIAKQINKSPRTVKTRMMEMQEKDLIERQNWKRNGKRNGEWVVKK